MESGKVELMQSICRGYLVRLRGIASRHGLGSFVDELIESNRRRECEATESEVSLLARCVDDERIERGQIPSLLGKSYRQCVKDGDFSHIKRLKRVGIYSKLSALLHGNLA